MSNRVKMIVGGICNLIALVTFALILVVLSENRVVHRVLAQTITHVSELNSDRVVLTTQDAGSFVGKQEPVSQDDPNEIPMTFFAFRGIPYSSPPIGELKWQPPQPVELKSTPHQASEFKPPCSQWSPTKKKVIGAPDCLYLNIFSPYIPSPSKRRISANITSWTVENLNLLPVLVYVHGGEYVSGSASKYSPDALMRRERVVLVTFNYRLGVLGFLSNGDVDLPGNYGLQDQIAALKWIQKYIHRFGGNPLRVTIFGSVEHLLVANFPVEEGQPSGELFHAAILKPQSTTMLSPYAKLDSKEGSKNFLKQLADNVGCSGINFEDGITKSLIECLRAADTDTLIRSQTKILAFHNFPLSNIRARPLGPVVDYVLLDDEPEVLFAAGKFREVPLLVGLSVNEGFNPLLEFYLKLSQKSSTSKNGTEGVRNLTDTLTEEKVRNLLHSLVQTVMVAVPDIDQDGAFERVFQSIWNHYFGGITSKPWKEEMDQVIQKLFRLLGDMLVNTGHCKLLHDLSANAKAPVYSYVFSSGISNFQSFFKATREIFENSDGVGGPKRPKRSLHLSIDTPWDDQYYLFHPVNDMDNFGLETNATHSYILPEYEMLDEGRLMTDILAKIWISFAKYGQPKQTASGQELADYNRWIRMEPGHRSLNYYLIGNSTLQRGMRSDFRKAECQFWMGTVPQVRKLSKVIQDLEPFPILFWSSIAVVVLFALIIVTLIILIACVKRRTGSYGGTDGIYLHNARQL